VQVSDIFGSIPVYWNTVDVKIWQSVIQDKNSLMLCNPIKYLVNSITFSTRQTKLLSIFLLINPIVLAAYDFIPLSPSGQPERQFSLLLSSHGVIHKRLSACHGL